jgi:hypothetical protein
MVRLTRVEKFKKDVEPKDGLEYPRATTELLIAAYGEGRSDPSLTSTAALLAKGLNEGIGYWLLCDCGTPKPLASQALIVTRRLASRYIFLREDGQKEGRHAHAESCPFFRAPAFVQAPAVARQYEFADRTVRETLGSHFAPRQSAGSSSAVPREGTGAGAGGHSSEPGSLASVLFALYKKTDIQTVLNGSYMDYKAQWKALRSALVGMTMDGAKLATDFCVTSIRCAGGLNENIRKENPAEWAKRQAPHGYVIDVIESIREEEGGTVLVNGDGHELFVVRALRPGAKTPGPWIAVVLMTGSVSRAGPTGLLAYVHPVMGSRNLLLVDSNLERMTLDVIARACRAVWSGASSVSSKIEKPLLDINVDGTGCRPDFLVTARGKKCVVETMGFDNEAYLARKEKTHATMAALGKLMRDSKWEHDDFSNAFKTWIGGR